MGRIRVILWCCTLFLFSLLLEKSKVSAHTCGPSCSNTSIEVRSLEDKKGGLNDKRPYGLYVNDRTAGSANSMIKLFNLKPSNGMFYSANIRFCYNSLITSIYMVIYYSY